MKSINYKKIIIALITIGIILRIIYIIYTPITERQHDMEKKYGHLDYIETIYETRKLPDNNKWQFYQQPLHHIIAALWLKANTICGIDLSMAKENIQILTCIYSIAIMFISYFILKEMEVKDKYKMLVMAIIAVHPTFIILAGSINNDILMIMFTFLSLLYLVKWHKNSSLKNTILLALFVGLGALTKISSTIIAIPILYVFIDKFFKDFFKTKEKAKYIRNYAIKFTVFGIIALGIGLSFSLRNMIKFNQSIFYVPKAGNSMYCGDRSLWDRFNFFSKEFAKVFCKPYEDCNIWAYLIKSSLFGEYNIDGINLSIERMLLIINIIIIIISIISLFIILIRQIRKESNSIVINTFIVFYITEMVMFLYGNISMPYGCTMDFRYIVPTIFLGMIFIVTILEKENEKYYKSVLSIVTLFSVFSLVFELTNMKMLVI